jgi:hypothetical protein
VSGVWVVCQHLISFAGGVQSFPDTVKGVQLLGTKFIHAGKYAIIEIIMFLARWLRFTTALATPLPHAWHQLLRMTIILFLWKISRLH